MTKVNPPAEDLSVLSRRGEASPSDRRRLDMVLGASRFERWLHGVGCDYDDMRTDCEGDSALLGRVVERAAQRRELRPRRSKRRVAVAAAAVACFASLGAAALTLPQLLKTGEQPSDVSCGACADNAGTAQDRPTGRARAVPATPADPDPPATPSSDPETEPPAVEATAPPSAAEQFAKANTLRKSGRSQAAIAAYRQLQRQHPSSPEGRLSHVLLGRILLQQGAASAAYQQFSRYLRTSPNGSLAEEALNGEAAALRMSGRHTEERTVNRQLVERFPNSVYAKMARKRLEETD